MSCVLVVDLESRPSGEKRDHLAKYRRYYAFSCTRRFLRTQLRACGKADVPWRRRWRPPADDEHRQPADRNAPGEMKFPATARSRGFVGWNDERPAQGLFLPLDGGGMSWVMEIQMNCRNWEGKGSVQKVQTFSPSSRPPKSKRQYHDGTLPLAPMEKLRKNRSRRRPVQGSWPLKW